MASESTKSKFDVFIEEKYIPLNKNMKIAIPIVLAAVLLAGFYFLVFSKNFTKIKDLKEQERSLQADVKKAKGAADNLEQHEQELKEIKQQFEKISIVLPKAKEIPALLTGISDHGTSAGLDFNLFTPGNETSKDFYAEIPVSINVVGSFHNVAEFFDRARAWQAEFIRRGQAIGVVRDEVFGPEKVQLLDRSVLARQPVGRVSGYNPAIMHCDGAVLDQRKCRRAKGRTRHNVHRHTCDQTPQHARLCPTQQAPGGDDNQHKVGMNAENRDLGNQ